MSNSARIKSGLYPELISTALRKHTHLPVRSERQEELPRFFVDNQQLQLIKNPDWQVIYGRRGTGKTMLLGMLREQCHRDFEKSRILAVNVTAQDLLVSPLSRSISDRLRALGYFQVFLENISEQLVGKVDYLLGSPSFLQRLTGSRKRQIDRIQDAAIQVLMLVQSGKTVDAFTKRQEVRENKDSDSETSADGGEVEASASSSKLPSAHSKISVGFTERRKREHSKTMREEYDRVPRFPMAREKILELLRYLDVARLDILIDEWHTLDPHATTAIQPEFAECMKRMFFGAPRISVKIATNRYQTRFSNRGKGAEYRGLEVGADLFEAANLDRTEQSLPAQVNFYTTLLYKRLFYCEPELAVFDSDNDGVPDSQFIYSLFRDEKSFQELVKGAEATPRDFLQTFNLLSRKRGFRNDPTWTIPMVHDAVRENGANLQEETDSSSEADQLLTRCIKSVVDRTGSRLFLVDREDRNAAHNAIEELIEKRLIDSYSKAELGPDIRTKFDAFLVHYGLWLDWRPLNITPENYEQGEIPSISACDTAKYKVNMSEIDTDIHVCPHCGFHFSSSAHPFHTKGLCPSCYEKIVDQSKGTVPVKKKAPAKKAAAKKAAAKKAAARKTVRNPEA